jgi:hypothetical protein
MEVELQLVLQGMQAVLVVQEVVEEVIHQVVQVVLVAQVIKVHTLQLKVTMELV